MLMVTLVQEPILSIKNATLIYHVHVSITKGQGCRDTSPHCLSAVFLSLPVQTFHLFAFFQLVIEG